MRVTIAAFAVLLPGAVLASALDLPGAYGNEAGCRYAATGDDTDDSLLMLKPDEYSAHASGCEFLQALTAKDGSHVITMLCSHEGETFRSVDFMRVQLSPDVGDSYDLFSASGEHMGIVGRCK